MGTIKDFEDLEIWDLSRQLVKMVYADFRSCRDFIFRNQICSAGISVMNNVSEGFCRNSKAEFCQFLKIAKGSAGEVKNMYYIAQDLHYLSSATASDRRVHCQRICNGIASLMNYLKSHKQKST